jgi:hypothetical protein
MNITVNVVLSRRSFSARRAGATMSEKPAIAVSLPSIFTKIRRKNPLGRIVESSGLGESSINGFEKTLRKRGLRRGLSGRGPVPALNRGLAGNLVYDTGFP